MTFYGENRNFMYCLSKRSISKSMTMTNLDSVKTDIITMVSQMEDEDVLQHIYEEVRAAQRSPEKVMPRLLDALTDVRQGLTYAQILAEQAYRPVSYQTFREVADEMEWYYSLEELLEQLD